LVDEASRDLETDKVHRATINYWFRHIWEYWWPFYPSVILICAITGFSIGKIVLVFLPASIVMVTLGYFFYLRQLPKAKTESAPAPKGSILRLISIGRAIVAVVILNFLLVNLRGPLESAGLPLQKLSERSPLVLALIVGIAMALWGTGLKSWSVAKMVLNRRVSMMMLTVGSILIFSHVLKDAGVIEQIAKTLASHDAPLLLLAVTMPFLVSFVTGLVVAYVGIALPILYPVFVASLPQSEVAAYVFIFSVSGYIAVMLTPVHLCLILSNEYFDVKFMQAARLLILPCTLSMAVYLGIFLLYRML
jgi:hypothetical protein